jgi:hypothetical protein
MGKVNISRVRIKIMLSQHSEVRNQFAWYMYYGSGLS